MRWERRVSEISMCIIKLFLVIYRWAISPFIHTIAGPGYGCRFVPTCSEYSKEAYDSFGLTKGFFLSLRRICRCNPFGGSGYDPIPVISPQSKETKFLFHHQATSDCREPNSR